MKVVLQRIGYHVFELLGLDRMGKKYHVLVGSYIFVQFYMNFEGVFVNTLLYRINDDGMKAVILYRGITYITSAVFFHVGAYISQKKTPLLATRLGGIGFLFMYLILFIWMEQMARIQYFLAVIAGMSGALYWVGHNSLIPHYTTKHNRDVGIAILGIIQGILTLCIPLMSGFIISLMPEISGYRVMFAVSMLAVIFHLLCMMRFYPVEKETHRSEYRLALKLIARKMSYKLMLGYEFIRGIRDGTFAFILNMLLFEIITEESVVGVNTFFTGIMAILGSWVYGKLVAPRLRVRFSTIAMAATLGVCGILFFNMSVPTVMLFTVVNAFMQLFFLYSYNNTTYDVLSQNKTSRRCASEMFAMRETAIMPGRLIGLWVVTLVPPTQRGYVQAMLLLTLAQLIGVGLMKLVQAQLDRKHRPDVSASPA